MASEANAHQGPILFWSGVAVAEFGAIHPGSGHPPAPAYTAAALLVAVGFLTVVATDHLPTEEARQRLRLGGYLAGALLVAHQFSVTTQATGFARVASLLLYAAAAVTAVLSHRVPGPRRPILLIATGLDPPRAGRAPGRRAGHRRGLSDRAGHRRAARAAVSPRRHPRGGRRARSARQGAGERVRARARGPRHRRARGGGGRSAPLPAVRRWRAVPPGGAQVTGSFQI
ncbi:hypothetical protein [Nonomuraea salmonea]|uniref:hypothetical protein n=1 Tax=Nonomuraea salmonea TaxID=46181 RepID=UPI0031F16EB2